MNAVSTSMAFLMGFTLSLHCAGMCGPIMLVLPFQLFSGFKKVLAIVLYHLGRIFVYSILAIILYSFRNLFEPKIQQYVSIILGVLLLIAGIFTFFPRRFFKIELPWSGIVKRKLGSFIGNPGFGTLTIAGMLNGLLPCGLVYVALSASVTDHSTFNAAMFMIFFGMGTMPILLAINILSKTSIAYKNLAFIKTNAVKKSVPYIMLLFGVIFVLRGLNLGIPYLSPKIEVSKKEIKASCCHKEKKA